MVGLRDILKALLIILQRISLLLRPRKNESTGVFYSSSKHSATLPLSIFVSSSAITLCVAL